MILKRISDHLKTHHRASLADMARHFDTTPEALRDMLSVLERKGRVRRLPVGTPCGGGCTQCRPETIELYEWNGPAAGTHEVQCVIPISGILPRIFR